MSSPGFIGIIANGEYKVAQYARWHCGPEEQGAEVMTFLANADLNILKAKVVNCRFVDNNELEKLYVSVGYNPESDNGTISNEVAKRFDEMYPSLSIHTGVDILDMVYESASEILLLSHADCLSAEFFDFAYIVNFDDGKLRCYESGVDNLYGEYDLDNIPTAEQLWSDYSVKMKSIYGEDCFDEEE